MPPKVQAFPTAGGAIIYRLPLLAFPNFWTYAHLVYADGVTALVDVGSGYDVCNAHLESGLHAVAAERGESSVWERLTHVLITHGHIDHYGGLDFVRQRTKAPIGVHELDAPVLSEFQAQRARAVQITDRFLRLAGTSEALHTQLMVFRNQAGSWYSPVPVDFTFEAMGMVLGNLRVVHVPGHCAGQVVIKIDDVLLSGDHVLKTISPHQSPQLFNPHMGLGLFLTSLELVRSFADSIRLTLGGHKGPVWDLKARIAAIQRLHKTRLGEILNFVEHPATIADVSRSLFPSARGRHALLALEETAAHLEFLVQTQAVRASDDPTGDKSSPRPILFVRDAAQPEGPRFES